MSQLVQEYKLIIAESEKELNEKLLEALAYTRQFDVLGFTIDENSDGVKKATVLIFRQIEPKYVEKG